MTSPRGSHVGYSWWLSDLLCVWKQFPGLAALPPFKDWGEADWPRSFFLPFLKIGVAFVFLQSSGTSPSHHDHLKIIESGLAMTSASSPSCCWCIPSGIMDLCMSSLLKYSLMLCLPCSRLPLVSWSWHFWRPVLLLDAEVKVAFLQPLSCSV